MAITYSVNFGLTNNNLVGYDGRLQTLKTLYADEIAVLKTCSLYSPEAGLKLIVNIADGEIVGLEANLGMIGSIPKASLTDFEYTEGCVKAEWDCGKLIADGNYIIEFNFIPFYDSDKKMIVFGNFLNGGIAVKICKNLFLSLDVEGKLCGITVKL